MTRQEIFDKVLYFLRQQGRPAGTRMYCMYRFEKEDGVVLKCAIGCLIPDDEYRIEFDHGMDLKEVIENVSTLSIDDLELLRKMQQAHYRYLPAEEWIEKFEIKMELIASHFKLSYSRP